LRRRAWSGWRGVCRFIAGVRASTAVRAIFADLSGERSVMIDGAAWIVMACNPES